MLYAMLAAIREAISKREGRQIFHLVSDTVNTKMQVDYFSVNILSESQL